MVFIHRPDQGSAEASAVKHFPLVRRFGAVFWAPAALRAGKRRVDHLCDVAVAFPVPDHVCIAGAKWAGHDDPQTGDVFRVSQLFHG